jgi:hypothetical protein
MIGNITNYMTINKAKFIGSLLFTIVKFCLVRIEDVYAVDEIVPRMSAAISMSESVANDEDIRVRKLTNYLSKHNSPLIDNAEDFVKYADVYGYGENWSMVAAIAGVESTFGKHIPANSYNAWGWGIPTGSASGIGFSDWEDGIATVSKGLRKNYMDKGAVTLSQIGPIYAPPSTTWAGKVSYFMREIENTSVKPELSL